LDRHSGFTYQGVVWEFISQEKWARAKVEMRWLWDLWLKDKTRILFKPLRSTRGFMVYVAGTYRWLRAYLKGIHLTLESWRPGKDDDSWLSDPESVAEDNAVLDIMKEDAWKSAVDKPKLGPAMNGADEVERQDGPTSGFVLAAVPGLGPNLEAILSFLETESPVLVMARPEACFEHVFGVQVWGCIRNRLCEFNVTVRQCRGWPFYPHRILVY
jgi:hypothetical protein